MKTLNEFSLRSVCRKCLLIAAAGIIATTVGGCSKKGNDDAAAKTEDAPTQVTVTQVTRADVSRNLQLSGSVAAVPNRDVKVTSLVAGRDRTYRGRRRQSFRRTINCED